MDGLRSKSADKRFIEIPPLSEADADRPIEQLISLVDPEKKLDAEKYLIENVYDRTLSERLFWSVGSTWDRNEDADILDRYVAFTGLGNPWWDRADRHFETSYALSYTDRNEATPDPEKDARFPGLRLAWSFWNEWGGTTTLANIWASNVSLSDASDWSFDTTTSLSVSITRHLALKASLQWLFNGRPAFEEIEVLAILPEGAQLDFGSVRIARERLDTIFTTSLLVTF